jgi:hypothetical protein
MRGPELHEILQGTPSQASRQSALIRHLALEANLIVELIERLKLIEPNLRSDCEGGSAAHLRAIERGDYSEAHKLITNYGIPRQR